MSDSVLVTGAAGFIGSHVADRLLASGCRVTAVDNFDAYYDPEQKRRNVASATKHESYQLIEADIRDRAALTAAFDAAMPDLVVHLAARAGVRSSVADPLSYVQVNEIGGLYVLEECRGRGDVPLVLASTSSAYGASQQVPFREDDSCNTPLSPYAASKRGSELMAHAFRHLYGLPVAILRFFTVYGPRGRPDMAVASFTRDILAGRPLRLHGERTARDFTFIDDIVDGVVGAKTWVQKTRGFDTFNLGRSEPVRVRRLIDLLSEALGKPAQVELAELGSSEVLVTAADVVKAQRAFEYRPKVSLQEGVKRWVEWLQNSDEAPPELRSQSG
jgi:UDP-glucuronate 4-epimerase